MSIKEAAEGLMKEFRSGEENREYFETFVKNWMGEVKNVRKKDYMNMRLDFAKMI